MRPAYQLQLFKISVPKYTVKEGVQCLWSFQGNQEYERHILSFFFASWKEGRLMSAVCSVSYPLLASHLSARTKAISTLRVPLIPFPPNILLWKISNIQRSWNNCIMIDPFALKQNKTLLEQLEVSGWCVYGSSMYYSWKCYWTCCLWMRMCLNNLMDT